MQPNDDNQPHIPPPPAHYPLPHEEAAAPPAEPSTAAAPEPDQPVDMAVQPHYEPPVNPFVQSASEQDNNAPELAHGEVVQPLTEPQAVQPEPTFDASTMQYGSESIGTESAAPFTPVPEPDLLPQQPNVDGAAEELTAAPKPADKFEHELHTYVPEKPITPTPEPIPHDAPREVRHPLDEASPAQSQAKQETAPSLPRRADTLSFEDLKADPIPKSPIPSVLPPNPLLGSDASHTTSDHAMPSGVEPAPDADRPRVAFQPPKKTNRLATPFIIAAVSIVLLVVIAVPFILSQTGSNKPGVETPKEEITLKNLPSGFVSVDRGCYSIPLPKDNNVPLGDSCALTADFGPKSEYNITITPQTKAYANSEAYYQKATDSPNELRIIAKSAIKLDGLAAVRVVHNVGTGSNVVKQLNIYVVTSSKGYKVGEAKIEGFEMTMSYNDTASIQAAEQLIARMKWR